MLLKFYRPREKVLAIKWSDQLQKIPLLSLMAVSIWALVLDLIITSGSTLTIMGLGCWVFIAAAWLSVADYPNHTISKIQQWTRKNGIWPLFFLFAFMVFWLDFLVQPGAAVFFQNAQDGLKTLLSAGGTNQDIDGAIDLLFNVLRGLLILYIGVSLVKVVNSAREDDDWKQIARVPLIIVVAVVVGDLLTTLVIG